MMRVLTCFVDEDTKVLVCLGGNKHGWEQEHGGRFGTRNMCPPRT